MDDDEEEEEDDEEVVVLLVVVPLGTALAAWLAGGAAAAAGGISRGATGFMCPASGPGRDRGATWDTGEDREPWASPTPSEFLHATIAMSTGPKLRCTNFSF